MADENRNPIVLDNHFETRVPSEEEVREYAEFLGVDPDTEPHLLWIAREGVVAPVPAPWKACQEEDGADVYYFNFDSGESSWDHPLDEKYKNMVEDYRKKKNGSCSPKGAASEKPQESKAADLTVEQPKAPSESSASPLSSSSPVSRNDGLGLSGRSLEESINSEPTKPTDVTSPKSASGQDVTSPKSVSGSGSIPSEMSSPKSASPSPEKAKADTNSRGTEPEKKQTSLAYEPPERGKKPTLEPLSSLPPLKGVAGGKLPALNLGSGGQTSMPKPMPLSVDMEAPLATVAEEGSDLTDNSPRSSTNGSRGTSLSLSQQKTSKPLKSPTSKNVPTALESPSSGAADSREVSASGFEVSVDHDISVEDSNELDKCDVVEVVTPGRQSQLQAALKAQERSPLGLESPPGPQASSTRTLGGGAPLASPDRGTAGVGLAGSPVGALDFGSLPAKFADEEQSGSHSGTKSVSSSKGAQPAAAKAKLDMCGHSGQSGHSGKSGGASSYSEVSEDFPSDFENLSPSASRGNGTGGRATPFGDSLELSATVDDPRVGGAATAALASKARAGGPPMTRWQKVEAEVQSLSQALKMLKEIRAKQLEFVKLLHTGV
eukprot:gnl/TRDRNA2_/TRDRNA2_57648_c0_seq1.p1 gnl/TRDRNA2_/TRDRNA2_57648_c0~~gnl/TRDRNA2_/TRDRNA2_57648_c0_seq1.p1  ORF type:complete len:631 (-),score=137.39 gnl/TRDRNA2_/TRDRNA2_57648_c0_seq1:50-1864(-)